MRICSALDRSPFIVFRAFGLPRPPVIYFVVVAHILTRDSLTGGSLGGRFQIVFIPIDFIARPTPFGPKETRPNP